MNKTAYNNKSSDLLSEITPIADIIEQVKSGKMYILVDDESRENEGDLMISSQFATAQAINFYGKIWSWVNLCHNY